jgi:phosphatidylglycerophosphate synthase
MLYRNHEAGLDANRLIADTLAASRVLGGEYIRHRLANDMQNPADRTWSFATKVAGFAATDFFDGKFARKSRKGPSRFGGFLDQMSDKWFFLRPTAQLVENGELSRRHLFVPLIRDIGATAVRYSGIEKGKNTDARDLGKYKMWAQCIALTAACSPLAHTQPNAVSALYDVATGFSAVSGADLAYNLQTGKSLVDNVINRLADIIETMPEGLNGEQLTEVIVMSAAHEAQNLLKLR